MVLFRTLSSEAVGVLRREEGTGGYTDNSNRRYCVVMHTRSYTLYLQHQAGSYHHGGPGPRAQGGRGKVRVVVLNVKLLSSLPFCKCT